MFDPRPEISTATRALAMVRCAPITHRTPCVASARDGAALCASRDVADAVHSFTCCCQSRNYCVNISFGDDYGHANPAIERPRHFLWLDMALRLQERHQARLRPEVCIDMGMEVVGQDTRDIFEQTTASDVRHRVD